MIATRLTDRFIATCPKCGKRLRQDDACDHVHAFRDPYSGEYWMVWKRGWTAADGEPLVLLNVDASC